MYAVRFVLCWLLRFQNPTSNCRLRLLHPMEQKAFLYIHCPLQNQNSEDLLVHVAVIFETLLLMDRLWLRLLSIIPGWRSCGILYLLFPVLPIPFYRSHLQNPNGIPSLSLMEGFGLEALYRI